MLGHGCGRIGFDPTGDGAGGAGGEGNASGDGGIAACQGHPAQKINETGRGRTVALAWDGTGYLAAWSDISGAGPYPIYTRKLDRWGVPVAPPNVVTVASIVLFGCARSLALARVGTGYVVGYCDKQGARVQIWMNRLFDDGTRAAGDVQVTTTNIDSDGAALAAATNVALAYHSSTTNDDWIELGFVDGSTLVL